MRINCHTPIFFDASVLVAGSHSPQGGSALVLDACKAGSFRAQTSFLVVLRSLHALRPFPEQSQQRFHRVLLEIDWVLVPVPSGQQLEHYSRYIDRKDVHVLAAAVEGGAEPLLTLDGRHILAAADAVERAGLPIVILRPGDFIRQYYPHHDDYPQLPAARSHRG